MQHSELCWVLLQVANGNISAADNSSAPPRSVDADMEEERKLAAMVCSLKNKDECLMCGS